MTFNRHDLYQIFQEIKFGNSSALTNLRWSLQKDNTTESGGNVGSDFRVISYDDSGANANSRLFIKRSSGFVGFGTTSPSNLISLAPGSARKIAIETSSSGAGDRLSLEAGQARASIPDINGGEMRISGGNSNGSGNSFVSIYTATPGTSGTTLQTASEKARVDGNGNFGINTTSPHSRLHVNGAVAVAFASKTAAYTLTATDSVIAADTTTAGFTVTLPTAAGIAGRIYTVKKIDSSANTVTIGTTSSQTIDGAASKVLTTQWEKATVISDGANWLII